MSFAQLATRGCRRSVSPSLLAFALTFCTQSFVYAAPPGHGVIDICKELKRPAVICQCSSKRMQQQVSKADFTDYSAVGSAYIALRRQGIRRNHAWAKAVDEYAQQGGQTEHALADRMSLAADAHMLAIQSCGQQK